MKTLYLLLSILLLSLHPVVTHAQKELWGAANTGNFLGLPVYYHNGALVKTDSIGNTFEVVHLFDSLHGRFNTAQLLQASNGKIYGTTNAGGLYNYGVLYEYDPVIDSYQVMIDFGSPAFPYAYPEFKMRELSPGLLYGFLGYGQGVFTYNIVTHVANITTSFPSFPWMLTTIQTASSGSLYKASDGYFYGTTSNYSDHSLAVPSVGAVYRIDPSTNVFSFVHPFSSTLVSEGQTPNGDLVETNGKLYSTTTCGGTYASGGGPGGVIFAYDLTTHAFTKYMDFDSATGISPTEFLKATSGKFYGYTQGNTYTGSTYRSAAMFEYDPITNVYTTKHTFFYNSLGYSATDAGAYPLGMVQASNGKLYSATEQGVFEYNIATDSLRAAVRFTAGVTMSVSLTEICRKPAYKYYSNTNDTACLGGPYQYDFHCRNAATVMWQHNGVPDPTQTTSILHFSPVVASDSGTWSCTLTNECGVTTPPAIHVAIGPLHYPGDITGGTIVCAGSAITLSDPVTGGAWSSSNGNATVSSVGIVHGINAGTDTITYIVPGTCGVPVHTVTINPLPIGAGTISGALNVCVGAVTALSDTVFGGVWSSGTTGIATVGSTGTVTGVAAGNAVISYALTNSCGTNVTTATVSVHYLPVAGTIVGATNICPASPALLSDAIVGGAWSSSATGIAAVNSTGVVTAVSAGAATISYSISNSCGVAAAIKPVVVNLVPVAGAITGSGSVCANSAIYLSDAVTGGVWSSANTGIATVDNTGEVFPVSAGSVAIVYTVTNFCGTVFTTTAVTVNPIPVVAPITGATTLCAGNAITLNDAAAGGTWNSSVPGVATISTTGVLTGITPGTTRIAYFVLNSCAAALDTVIITVTSSVTAGTITGNTTVCAGLATTLSDAIIGGIWSSDNTGIATVSNTGTVTGVTPGTANISYTVNVCGVAVASVPVTVNLGMPVAGSITGSSVVCVGAAIILSDATATGVWSSSNAGIATVSGSGSVTGVMGGNAIISYTVVNSCGTTVATQWVTVNALPVAGTITGSAAVCAGANLQLSDAATGGVWSSSATSIATVNGTGVVTGNSTGTATISYTVINSCNTAVATQVITINAAPVVAAVSGVAALCRSTSGALSDPIPGGIWSSGAPAIASVNSAGMLYGITAGITTISYTVSNSCGLAVATHIVTVDSIPAVDLITGNSVGCLGSSVTLSDATAGGAWSVSNTSVATVNNLGVVTILYAGVSIPFPLIGYSITNSCGTRTASFVISVQTLPVISPITGGTAVCAGSSLTLSDATTGSFSWSSSASGIATVSFAGVVTGVTGGTATISYSTTNSCGTVTAIQPFVVDVAATAGTITGAATVCTGGVLTLSDAIPGGTWSSSAMGTATVDSVGIITGVAIGAVTISYTVTNSCGTAVATKTITVSAAPATGAITGTAPVCVGASIPLSDPTTGGAWSSSNTGIATISNMGLVTGISAGTATITYSVPFTCGAAIATATITVNPLPNAGAITGGSTVCESATISLSDAVTGGTWSSSATSIASVSNTGMVTGITVGNTTISYSVTNSCGTADATNVMAVDPLPDAGIITGADTVCATQAITLSDATATGTWSSSDNTVATVNTSGVVSGVSGGAVVITYTVVNNCGTATVIFPVYVRTLSACNTGVKQWAGVTALKVFPNPNMGIFTVNMLSDIDEEVKIIISNPVGEKVKELTIRTNTPFDITLEEASGIYLLSAITSHGRYEAKLVVIK